MATNPHPRPVLHDAADSGTPVINYIGPAAIAPLPDIAPAPAVHPPARPADRTLSWAKRIHFGLLVAFLSLFLYDFIILNRNDGWLLLLVGVPFVVGLWLVGIGVAQGRSHYAEWGFVAVISTFMMSAAMDNGIWRYLNYINIKELVASMGDTFSFTQANKGLFFLGIAFGFALVAGFAVIKSLRSWRAVVGLLLVATTVVGVLLEEYLYGVGTYPDESMFVDSVNRWGQRIAVLAPVLLIALYILSRQRQQPNTPPNVKSQG